jgi:hypothetical protein
MRKLSLIFFLLAMALAADAAGTNYFCVVCGKGPLTGQIWMSKWGAVCSDCYKLENHCSLCGLPIRPGDGAIKTGDGRFICKFDRPNTVLDAAGAREVFADTRRELVGLFGSGFALKYPDVTVNLFDVDYWSEQGHGDNLHKFGFASTRKTPKGDCTHEVVLLSGRLRSELTATAAHEYTHLWINENRPDEHVIDPDTLEAICELSAYLLAGAEKMPEQQQRILANPYTHGKINTLVPLAAQTGIGYILNWVKNGTTSDITVPAYVAPVAAPVKQIKRVPPPLPEKLTFTGFSVIGTDRKAIINGLTFAPGEERRVQLRDKSVRVRCREIGENEVAVQIDDAPELVKLKLNKPD